MPPKFEEEYEDVLQNIEAGIMQVFREHPELTDRNADKALEGLVRFYQAQANDRPAPALKLNELVQAVFDSVQVMCDWRLGATQAERAEEDDSAPELVEPEPLTLDEIIACLKRIRRSISLWTKQSGRQGYLNYVDNFIL